MREANVHQNNGAWFNARTGCLTASRMKAASSFIKGGKDSAERRALKIEILAERLTGNIVPKYCTPAMQWGIDQEPVAKQFLAAKGKEWMVEDLGFVEHPTILNCGASPDGYLPNKNALLEVKCPTTSTMVEWLLSAKDPSWLPGEYLPQMTLQSVCMAGMPVYFCAFDPRLPDQQKMILRKYEPTKEYSAEIESIAIKFLEEIDQMFEQITTGE